MFSHFIGHFLKELLLNFRPLAYLIYWTEIILVCWASFAVSNFWPIGAIDILMTYYLLMKSQREWHHRHGIHWVPSTPSRYLLILVYAMCALGFVVAGGYFFVVVLWRAMQSAVADPGIMLTGRALGGFAIFSIATLLVCWLTKHMVDRIKELREGEWKEKSWSDSRPIRNDLDPEARAWLQQHAPSLEDHTSTLPPISVRRQVLAPHTSSSAIPDGRAAPTSTDRPPSEMR